MAFVNINKVTLEDTDKVEEAMAAPVLLLASLIYDAVVEEDFKMAASYINGLQFATATLGEVLNRKVE